ncbi:MAG: DUF3991 and TOPRIM domain-containing protein [Geminicoccaceae bacterium]
MPGRILHLATRHDLIREGPRGSAWFAHRGQEGRLAGIEMRGPGWRGMAAGSDKTLFCLPGGSLSAPRLAVVEAPIDALSLATLEGPRADTLYLATAGGIGPGTLQALLASRVTDPAAELVAASDADPASVTQRRHHEHVLIVECRDRWIRTRTPIAPQPAIDGAVPGY